MSSESYYPQLRRLLLGAARNLRARARRPRQPFGGDPANGFPVDTAAMAGLAEIRRNMVQLRANRSEVTK